VTETEMSSLHNQHLPDMAQVGNVLNDIIVPGRESVPQKEGDDVTSENHQFRRQLIFGAWPNNWGLQEGLNMMKSLKK